MTEKQPAVVVYCASSAEIDKVYSEAAAELGKLLAVNGITCITGAGKQGLMGDINDAVLNHGGRVTGIIPKFMVDAGWCHDALSETVVTDSIHERKEQMASMADAAIALPGGLGTLEELAEILTWKQLGLFKKPVIILNINNYYDSFLKFLDFMIAERFLNSEYSGLWQIASTPQEAIDIYKNNSNWNPSFTKYNDNTLKESVL